jgi:hypothetical protein
MANMVCSATHRLSGIQCVRVVDHPGDHVWSSSSGATIWTNDRGDTFETDWPQCLIGSPNADPASPFPGLLYTCDRTNGHEGPHEAHYGTLRGSPVVALWYLEKASGIIRYFVVKADDGTIHDCTPGGVPKLPSYWWPTHPDGTPNRGMASKGTGLPPATPLIYNGRFGGPPAPAVNPCVEIMEGGTCEPPRPLDAPVSRLAMIDEWIANNPDRCGLPDFNGQPCGKERGHGFDHRGDPQPNTKE